jgi:plastocyanin
MTMLKLASLVTVAVAGLLVTASAVPAAPPASVNIKDFTYGPSTLTVPAGAQVTWTNHDEETHTITSATGAFGSAGLGHDETFTQTFARPGTYAYFCALHPQMRATVVVR